MTGRTVTQARAVPQASASGSGFGGPQTSMQISGEVSLRVLEGQRLETLSGGAGEGSDLLWLLAFPGLVAGLTLAGVRQPALLRPLPTRWRRRLYRRWEDAGVQREAKGEFGSAGRYYRRLTRLWPQRAMGWYLLARSRLERGDHSAVVATVDEARQRLDAVPLDLLELKVAALWETGAEGEAVGLLEEIGDQDPGVARRLAEDLDAGERLDEEGPDWWSGGEGRDLVDGYV